MCIIPSSIVNEGGIPELLDKLTDYRASRPHSAFGNGLEVRLFNIAHMAEGRGPDRGVVQRITTHSKWPLRTVPTACPVGPSPIR